MVWTIWYNVLWAFICFAVSRVNRKRGRGKYKSKTVDKKQSTEEKLK